MEIKKHEPCSRCKHATFYAGPEQLKGYCNHNNCVIFLQGGKMCPSFKPKEVK